MRGLILTRFLKKYVVKVWTGFIWLSLGPTVKMIMILQVPSKMAFLDEEWTLSNIIH
jgi:phenylpropionate dioxygenase-like ring-hydroxylating dioxygenase large terminal subunit